MNLDNPESDPRELMRRAKSGDTEAFGSLYSFYFRPVFRYIIFKVQDKEVAEDLTQDVFLKVYKSIHKFKEMDKSPLAYFFTVARNSVIDYWRKKKEILSDNPAKYATNLLIEKDSVRMSDLKETRVILHQAIARLTDKQREVIILRFISGLSHKEISVLLGKTEAATRQLQSQALRALRRQIKQ